MSIDYKWNETIKHANSVSNFFLSFLQFTNSLNIVILVGDIAQW